MNTRRYVTALAIYVALGPLLATLLIVAYLGSKAGFGGTAILAYGLVAIFAYVIGAIPAALTAVLTVLASNQWGIHRPLALATLSAVIGLVVVSVGLLLLAAGEWASDLDQLTTQAGTSIALGMLPAGLCGFLYAFAGRR